MSHSIAEVKLLAFFYPFGMSPLETLLFRGCFPAHQQEHLKELLQGHLLCFLTEQFLSCDGFDTLQFSSCKYI